jgi:pimeloyl-ACP methyl ester carboxylesterase
VNEAALGGGPFPASFTSKERAAIEDLRTYRRGGGPSYLVMLSARPQAVGYGMTDSPAGLAAFMLVHSGFARWRYGKDPAQEPTRDEVLDDFSLYWLTNTAASAARFYWENRTVNLTSATSMKTGEIKVPVAITVFPGEVVRAQESWARRAFPTLSYFHEVDRGGHFAMWEYPALFATELRAAFEPFRARALGAK